MVKVQTEHSNMQKTQGCDGILYNEIWTWEKRVDKTWRRGGGDLSSYKRLNTKHYKHLLL